ncbi:MAG TPA: hypothetical protein VHO06_24285 [Polyangia bacterium]|nr:hypothetical protein [Polyangia bacterium]
MRAKARGLAGGLALAALGSLFVAGGLGCGSAAEHPDTGYGADQPVPATENCVDLCHRFVDCVADLCDENTDSTRYASTVPAEEPQCEATCTDAEVQARVTASMWQCIFQQTCRQVFAHNACQTDSSFECL